MGKKAEKKTTKRAEKKAEKKVEEIVEVVAETEDAETLALVFSPDEDIYITHNPAAFIMNALEDVEPDGLREALATYKVAMILSEGVLLQEEGEELEWEEANNVFAVIHTGWSLSAK